MVTKERRGNSTPPGRRSECLVGRVTVQTTSRHRFPWPSLQKNKSRPHESRGQFSGTGCARAAVDASFRLSGEYPVDHNNAPLPRKSKSAMIREGSALLGNFASAPSRVSSGFNGKHEGDVKRPRAQYQHQTVGQPNAWKSGKQPRSGSQARKAPLGCRMASDHQRLPRPPLPLFGAGYSPCPFVMTDLGAPMKMTIAARVIHGRDTVLTGNKTWLRRAPGDGPLEDATRPDRWKGGRRRQVTC